MIMRRLAGLAPRYGSWFETGAIGLMYFVSFLYIGSFVTDWLARDVPVDRWFTVEQLLIGDDSGPTADPMIYFTRTIHQSTPGRFVVTLYRLTSPDDKIGVSWCSPGEGSADYKAGRRLPNGVQHLSWLMNREETPCHFVPGRYYAVVTWTFTPPGYPPKPLRVETNVFTIHEVRK